MEPESEGPRPDSDEIRRSVCFQLINDLSRTSKITEAEAELLRERYRRLANEKVDSLALEENMIKKARKMANDILSDKILLEKGRNEEESEILRLRKLEDEKETMIKELEYTEQQSTMARFELSELTKAHEQLVISLEEMKKNNHDTVEPVLEELRNEIEELQHQTEQTRLALEKEANQKKTLSSRIDDLDARKQAKVAELARNMEKLDKARDGPDRIRRQTVSISKTATTMSAELKATENKIKEYDTNLESKKQKRVEVEQLRASLSEKIELHKQTIEQRERDVATVESSLQMQKAKKHDLTTRKVELNVKKKEFESRYRHLSDQLGFVKKEYDNHKRLLKKKRGINDGIREVLPTLESRVLDQEASLRSYKEERDKLKKTVKDLKADLDTRLALFLQQGEIEKSKKDELEKTMKDVDSLEAEVVHWVSESKRQTKLIGVLSAQRDIKARECARVDLKEKEARQQVRIKELVILDLTKRCSEVSNRLKEFSALYEVVKNERNKYVNLIQSSTQALAEMKEKIRILENEREILGNESNAKDKALTKERNAHQVAQNQRDTLRQDMNRLLSEYRSKQNFVEQQIQSIEKLNIVINTIEKEMLDLKSRYEHAVEERNIAGVQLIDKNDELCILYERANQQQEALKKGEVVLLRKEEELRMLRIQKDELKRRYMLASKRLPEVATLRTKIATLEQKYNAECKNTEDLSNQIQDPQNQERWRALEGEDPSLEQLNSKIKVLEDRLDTKREQLLEKELVLEEVTSLTEKLRDEAILRRDHSKKMADILNDFQSKIRDTTKKMLATVSELSMYQATALRLQQEKSVREKSLQDAKWRMDHNEPPSDDAVREWNRNERRRLLSVEATMAKEEGLLMLQPGNMTKTTAEPRPNAYLPEEMGIPKPYGSLAPFKPSEAGSTMRHIRPPQPKAIEL